MKGFYIKEEHHPKGEILFSHLRPLSSFILRAEGRVSNWYLQVLIATSGQISMADPLEVLPPSLPVTTFWNTEGCGTIHKVNMLALGTKDQ